MAQGRRPAYVRYQAGNGPAGSAEMRQHRSFTGGHFVPAQHSAHDEEPIKPGTKCADQTTRRDAPTNPRIPITPKNFEIEPGQSLTEDLTESAGLECRRRKPSQTERFSKFKPETIDGDPARERTRENVCGGTGNFEHVEDSRRDNASQDYQQPPLKGGAHPADPTGSRRQPVQFERHHSRIENEAN